MTDLASLQEILGVTFQDVSLLEQSLVHRSYLNENPDFHLPSNERLEFLGDSLLSLVVAEKLYAESADLSEGRMTRLRASVVRGEALARMATTLGLGERLYLGHGEEASGGRQRTSNLAGLLEAVLGAVLVDQGFPAARDLVLRLFDAEIRSAIEGRIAADYKSRLQEVVQAQHQATPIYRTTREEGPDHAKEFTVEVLIGDQVVGAGHGKSKRQAEAEAARQALERLDDQ